MSNSRVSFEDPKSDNHDANVKDHHDAEEKVKDKHSHDDDDDDEDFLTTDSGHVLSQDKKYRFSTRDNSMNKWQNQHHPHSKNENKLCTGTVLGALQVSCEPYLDLTAPLEVMDGKFPDLQEKWKAVQDGWKNDRSNGNENGDGKKSSKKGRSLHSDFIKACEGVPTTTSCCGLIPNDDERVRDLVPYLNKYWAPKANVRMAKYGASVHAFLWHWQNVQGKADTYILLLRFCEL